MKKTLLIYPIIGALLLFAGLFFVQGQQLRRLEHQTAELHRSILLQTAEEAEALTMTMEKVLLTSDAAHAAALLHRIGLYADHVHQGLAMLPISQPALLSAQLFTQQLSDEISAMLPLLLAMKTLTPENRTQLSQQLALCSQLSSQLAIAEVPADVENLALDAIFPAHTAEIRGLPPGEITQEEAVEIARSMVGDDRVRSIHAAPGTSGALAAYGVTVQTEDIQLNIEITRQGGKLLWMMPETASFTPIETIDVCRRAAADFLGVNGFGQLEACDYQLYDGLCVFTLVPVQDDVLLYPDLVRVQVRMDTAQVVGLEAHQYWTNHVKRSLPDAVLTLEEAVQPLAEYTQLQGHRLCLIPSGEKELLCYELTAVYQGETYLVFVDASTGQQAEVVKKIQTDYGTAAA